MGYVELGKVPSTLVSLVAGPTERASRLVAELSRPFGAARV